MAYKPPHWKTDDGVITDWQAAYHDAANKVADLNARLDDRLTKHNETLDKLISKQGQCESLRKDADHLLKAMNQSTKERNEFLEDRERLEKELESEKEHVGRLIRDLNDVAGDYRKAKDRAEKSGWMQLATSTVLILVSALLILKTCH